MQNYSILQQKWRLQSLIFASSARTWPKVIPKHFPFFDAICCIEKSINYTFGVIKRSAISPTFLSENTRPCQFSSAKHRIGSVVGTSQCLLPSHQDFLENNHLLASVSLCRLVLSTGKRSTTDLAGFLISGAIFHASVTPVQELACRTPSTNRSA